MRFKPTSFLFGLSFLCLFDMFAGQTNAQLWVDRETERQLAPGVYVPFDGAGYVQRYHYGAGVIYPYGYRRGAQFKYIEYLDRLDRSEKFGYRRPRLPNGLPPSWEPSHPQVFIRLVPSHP